MTVFFKCNRVYWWRYNLIEKLSFWFSYFFFILRTLRSITCFSNFWQFCTGAAEPGGSGGVGPPLEFEIYLVNFLKNRKKKGFFSIGPPLGKNRSSAPVNKRQLLSLKTFLEVVKKKKKRLRWRSAEIISKSKVLVIKASDGNRSNKIRNFMNI